MLLRRHAAPDRPFAYTCSALRLPFPGNSRYPAGESFQHLAYLRKRGLVECTRHGTWMIYSLPSRSSVELEANLKCLQDCAHTDKRFRTDLKALEKVRADCEWVNEALENKRTCTC
jgi:ArsR family transcriptional regulator, arsenate/arsenite/antimonite-responsive transcriptional repressor